MTLLETIQNNKNKSTHKIKCVKNASIYESNNIIYCVHYDTVIFAYDQKNKIIEIQKDLSMTSNRQIQHLLRFFDLKWDQCVNVSKYEKWAFKRHL